MLSTRAKTVLGARLAAAGRAVERLWARQGEGLCGNAASRNDRDYWSFFTPSQYREAADPSEAGRGPCHLDLGEAVLACGNKPVS